jgi:hypothetical protein
MVAMAATTEIEGTVERVGNYGFTLTGREGWVSLSKFANPKPALPEEGQRVRVGLDKGGYARSVVVIDGAPVLATRAETVARGGPSKDVMIARMNSLTNAVTLLSSGGRVVALADVLGVASTFESWVKRE